MPTRKAKAATPATRPVPLDETERRVFAFWDRVMEHGEFACGTLPPHPRPAPKAVARPKPRKAAP